MSFGDPSFGSDSEFCFIIMPERNTPISGTTTPSMQATIFRGSWAKCAYTAQGLLPLVASTSIIEYTVVMDGAAYRPPSTGTSGPPFFSKSDGQTHSPYVTFSSSSSGAMSSKKPMQVGNGICDVAPAGQGPPLWGGLENRPHSAQGRATRVDWFWDFVVASRVRLLHICLTYLFDNRC